MVLGKPKGERIIMKMSEKEICKVVIERMFTKDREIFISGMYCKNSTSANRLMNKLKKEKYVVGTHIETIDDEKELKRIDENYIWDSPCHQH